MKNFAKLAISILLLFTMPTAMGTFEIQQGPSALAASPGATAWGGDILITDPKGNAEDGDYYALMGLHAIAYIPANTEGSAYANFYNHDGKFERTQELLEGQGKGSNVKFDMVYLGSAGANVEKTRPNGPALAFGAIGCAVGDFADTTFDPNWLPGDEAIDTAAGASGMMAVLSLPDGAVGNAGAAGAAGYTISKIGKTVVVDDQITSDEVLEVYGNTLGKAVITGPGQLVNGAAAAQNQVLGVAALGTASFATDFYGQNPGAEGQGLTASGMLSLAGALGNAAARPSRIETIAEGTTDGGFWDGATPLGTDKRVGVNENGMTQTTGKVSSKAEAYLNNDAAASHSILANIAFHSNSPLWLDPAMTSAVQTIPGMIGPEMKTQTDGKGDVCEAYGYLFETLETVAKCHCDDGNFDSILDQVGADNKKAITQYIPQTSKKLCAGDDPIVALNLALTAAAASRTQQGSLTSPILTAESYIDTDSVAQATHDGDRAVVSKMDKASLGSGAHLRSMPGNYASTGFGIQAAGQAWDWGLPGYPTAHGNLAVYGAITQGPPYNGDRWNDAGSYVRFEEGMMESSKGSSYYRTTNGPLGPEGAITWIQGGDTNPQIRGQNYNSLFEDSVSGLPQLTLKTDNLAYIDNFPVNRDTAWVSATVHGGI